MPLKSAIYLFIHLLLVGWTGSLISGYSLGVRQEGQDAVSNDMLGELSYVRERRNAPEEGNGVKTPNRVLYLRTTPPKTATVVLNDNYILECKAGGNPMPIVTWLKDGIEIEQGDYISNGIKDTDFIPSGLGSTMSRLFLDCMTVKDVGVYTCVASSPFQRITSDTSVFVTRSHLLPTEISPICSALSSSSIVPHTQQPPRIYMHTTRVLQVIGKDVLMMCRHSGASTHVKWTKNEEEMVPNNARTTVLRNGDLLIRNVRWLDMGLYKCEAFNEYGRDDVTTFLYPMKSGK